MQQLNELAFYILAGGAESPRALIDEVQRFRKDELVASIRGAIDTVATTEQLEHIAGLIPDEWLASAAMGSPDQCVEKVRGQFDLGCDGVILHGASPDELRPIVEAYRKTRPSGKFDSLTANPGGQ